MDHPIFESTEDSLFGKYTPEEFYARHGVKHTETYIKNPQGLFLYGHSWLPRNQRPKALLMVCHGYAADSNWLVQLTCVFFAKHGYSVHALDHMGHGKSTGLRGYIPSVDSVVNDCIQFFEPIRTADENVGLNAYLYGESLGATLILKMHLRQPEVYKGAIFSCAMFGISGKFRPHWILVETLHWLARRGFGEWAIVPYRDLPEVSVKELWKRQLARRNPYRYGTNPRCGTSTEFLRVTYEIMERMSDVTIPFLIAHGKDDVVTDPETSIQLYEKASSKDKTLKLYEGMWHQLIGEPNESVEKVFEEMLAWLNARCTM